jgi:hypothetical protein
MRDEGSNARHRIDAANSLRQAAIDQSSEAKAAMDKFTININFGTNKIAKQIELKPRTPEKTDWELNDG